tara:strand:- start:411 stop:1307 length:897 start_codon:yes stop_codon:yes gene_type:complete
MKILSDKIAIVTGGARGIGRGHCLHLAKSGATVVVNDIDNDESKKVVKEIRSKGGIANLDSSDISSRKGSEDLIKGCIDKYGTVDILVNNAGILRDRTFLKMTDEEFDDVWKIHVKGTFWCSQAVSNFMKENKTGGSIINTTSGAHFGNFGQTNYSAAKGAIASMTYTLAIELAKYGIRVNAIGPTGTTRMSDTFNKSSNAEGRAISFIDPTLNGPLVVFLCSEKAVSISGQVFGCGGNRLALMVQPHYGKTLEKEGGWSVEDIEKSLLKELAPEFGPLGMLSLPYPFSDGVKISSNE